LGVAKRANRLPELGASTDALLFLLPRRSFLGSLPPAPAPEVDEPVVVEQPPAEVPSPHWGRLPNFKLRLHDIAEAVAG
jgi:hypothetical protein